MHDDDDDWEQKGKNWASRYILDPLTEPEPSQRDGPGSSFFNPQRSLSLNCKPSDIRINVHRRTSNSSTYPSSVRSASLTRSHVPIHQPKPISPARAAYLPPTEWAPAAVVLGLKRSQSLTTPRRPYQLGRSQDLQSSIELSNVQPLGIPPRKEEPSTSRPQKPASPEPKPEPTRSQASHHSFKAETASASPKLHSLHRVQSSRSLQSSQASLRSQKTTVKSYQPVIKPETRVPLATSSPRLNRPRASRKPPQTHHTQGTAEIIGEILADRTSAAQSLPDPTPASRPGSILSEIVPATILSDRSSSFLNRAASATAAVKVSSPERPSSTMSQRSVSTGPERLQAESRSESRSKSRSGEQHRSEHRHRSRRNRPLPDTIDSLDKSSVGGAYHHGGPYDATLAAVNRHKKTSPVAAVKRSNIEALRATPREYIRDSLDKHVPLQGTATIPPGMEDMSGRTMRYREGADLMREADAPGGAYKRYDFVQYHPDDLKGKGEPSYSIERALKEHSSSHGHRHRASFTYGMGSGSAYELQDRHSRSSRTSLLSRNERSEGSRPPAVPPKEAMPSVRRQSFSAMASGSSQPPRPSEPTGNRFADGLKRRIGSLRRK